MTSLKTVSEAINLFEQYFPSGSNYNSKLTQITSPRKADPITGKVGETNAMRLGEQLQFLGALHNQVPDTNTARQGRIKSEIASVLNALQTSNYLKITKADLGENYLNESFIVMGLSIIKGGTAYNKLESLEKARVDNGLNYIVPLLKSVLKDAYATGGTWDTTKRTPTTYTEHLTGKTIKVPLMSLNSTVVIIGALGMYENLVAKSSGSSELITNFANVILTQESEDIVNGLAVKNGYFPIGGGLKSSRRIFGSSGYNAVVGQAMMLAYRGLSQKPFTDTASSANKYQGVGERIAKYYEKLMDKMANNGTEIRLDEFHDSEGTPVTEARLREALAKAGSKIYDSSDEANQLPKALALIVQGENQAHRQSSVYLYSLAWGCPVEFLRKLDRHIVQTEEANPELKGVSAMRASMNAPGSSDSHNATSGRVLTGFSALMMRGIETITDGHE